MRFRKEIPDIGLFSATARKKILVNFPVVLSWVSCYLRIKLPTMELSFDTMYQAIIEKDTLFEDVFFTAVKTTGIF
jgi:hypothetical protein